MTTPEIHARDAFRGLTVNSDAVTQMLEAQAKAAQAVSSTSQQIAASFAAQTLAAQAASEAVRKVQRMVQEAAANITLTSKALTELSHAIDAEEPNSAQRVAELNAKKRLLTKGNSALVARVRHVLDQAAERSPIYQSLIADALLGDVEALEALQEAAKVEPSAEAIPGRRHAHALTLEALALIEAIAEHVAQVEAFAADVASLIAALTLPSYVPEDLAPPRNVLGGCLEVHGPPTPLGAGEERPSLDHFPAQKERTIT